MVSHLLWRELSLRERCLDSGTLISKNVRIQTLERNLSHTRERCDGTAWDYDLFTYLCQPSLFSIAWIQISSLILYRKMTLFIPLWSFTWLYVNLILYITHATTGLVKSWWLFVFFKEVFKRKFLSAHELRALIPVSLFSVIWLNGFHFGFNERVLFGHLMMWSALLVRQ